MFERRSAASRRVVQMFSAAMLAGLSVACSHAASKATVDPNLRGAGAIERQIQGGSSAAPRLDHVIPARDSQGSLPTRFEWTAVPGAESYSVGIWNEVDMLIWRINNITTNSLVPTDLKLDPGTYFWTISAIRGGDEIAASGLSAFVVRPAQP